MPDTECALQMFATNIIIIIYSAVRETDNNKIVTQKCISVTVTSVISKGEQCYVRLYWGIDTVRKLPRGSDELRAE